MNGAQAFGRQRQLITISILLLVTGLPCSIASADETADLARIIELNDAYGEATRRWRNGEITRAEMQAQHKAIQAEARQIHSSYGRVGTYERREWDRKVTAAKNVHAKELRQAADAAKAEQRAAERAEAEAAREESAALAAEEQRISAQQAAERAAEERAQAATKPIVPVNLVVELTPQNQLQEDALALAPLYQEDRALSRELYQLNLKSRKSSADVDRIALITERRAILEPQMEAIRTGYSNENDDLRRLNLLTRALSGDLTSIEPEDATGWPPALQQMVTTNNARETASWEASQAAARAERRAASMNELFSQENGTTALIVAILVGIGMSFGAPRGIASLSTDGRTLKLAGWKYDLDVLSGVVLDSQQREEEETVIEASGGHGIMVNGTGYITPRQEAVKDVTTFDTLFVRDDDGTEHEVEMEDFGLSLRIGNRVSVVRASGARGDERPILLYNEDTRKHFYSTRVMRDLLKPSFLWAIFHAALVVIIAGGLAFPLLDEGEVLGSVLATVFCLYWIGGNRLTVGAVRAGLFAMGATARALVARVARDSNGGQPASVGV
jgi:hypothetical protein